MPNAIHGNPHQLHRLRTLHLFAGAGGGILADLLLGHQCVCAVEIDGYCQRVLVQRQADGLLPWFPIFPDVTHFDGTPWRGHVDVVCAGFPCQPWSVAGQRKGQHDKRNLWPDTFRVVCDIRPRYVFLENVPGLLAHEYFGHILGNLAEAWYDARWCVLGADDVGAPHHRKRLWLLATNDHGYQLWQQSGRQHGTTSDVAYPNGSRSQTSWQGEAQTWATNITLAGGSQALLADTECQGLALRQSQSRNHVPQQSPVERTRWWATEPDVGRVVDALAHRVDRLTALGNGQVPLVAATAWHLLHQRFM